MALKQGYSYMILKHAILKAVMTVCVQASSLVTVMMITDRI